MGGSARVWEAVLPADLVPGSEVELRLVMTKFQAPEARVAWELRLEASGE